MPHTESAKKRSRQSEKRRVRNRAAKKVLKNQLKKYLDVVKTGTAEQATEELKAVAKRVDKAGAKGVIHPNKAARLKSRTARKLNAKKTAPAK
jgi:small subunit ribosomal protein S20